MLPICGGRCELTANAGSFIRSEYVHLPEIESVRLSILARCLAALGCIWLLVGCASGHKAGTVTERKWYESTMDSEDRSFFLGSFLGGR